VKDGAWFCDGRRNPRACAARRWRSSCFVACVLLRFRLTAPVLVALLALAPSANAQERNADLERARALFDEAGELEREGQWPAAQDRLRAALRIRETANLRYALAWALANDDKSSEARIEYEIALRLAQRTGNEEVRVLASTRIAELDRRTPPRPPILPWVLVGGGGVLVVSGVLLFASSSGDASARDDDMRKWCDATACIGGAATRPETAEAAAFRREASDAASRGNTKQVVGGILGGLGAVGIGVGVYTLLRNGTQREPAKAARSSSLRIGASPVAGGGMASAAFAF